MKIMLNIEPTRNGIRIHIKVQPRSSSNQLVGEQNGILKVKITAPPVEGEANAALVKYLAEIWDLPRKNIKLIKGDSSRIKLLEIEGINREELLAKIEFKTSS